MKPLSVMGCLVILLVLACHRFDPDARAGTASPGMVAEEIPAAYQRNDVTALMRHLESPDEVTRLIAAKALGEMGPAARAALAPLKALAHRDPDADVRQVARNALGKIGRKSDPAPARTARGPVAMEKWVSPQGVVSLLKPEGWAVEEHYGTSSARLVISEGENLSRVTFFVSRNDRGIKDSMVLLGESLRDNARNFPDFQFSQTWRAQDGSKAMTDVSFTANGIAVTGRFYYLVGADYVLAMTYQAPESELEPRRRLLLTILNNINFHDEHAERIRLEAIQKSIMKTFEPVQARMVWRRAPDGSARFLAPADWSYQAQKGKAVVGSERDDAAFVFTSIEAFAKNPGVRTPGVLLSPYLPPDRFIGLFLRHYAKAGNIQVLQRAPDRRTMQEAKRFCKTGCEAQTLTVKFSAKGGRRCLSAFKVITARPAAFSGLWWSIVSGFWAPEDRFVAYVPLLERIATSYQVNDAWAKSYIAAGVANLKRLERKTRQSIQELHQARYERQRSWEANQARKDYSNWKFSNYLRDETNWVSKLEGGKVYHTDAWGTKDTWTGDYYEGSPYNYVNTDGRNPRHPSLENMQEIDSFELYRRYIQ